jgi:integrase
MGSGRRFAEDPFELPNGKKVGFSFKERGNIYRVVFRHPTEDKYVEISTGCTTKADANSEAARLILNSYGYNKGKDPRKVTWAEALAELQKLPTIRFNTFEGFRTAINNFRQTITSSKGPGDVTIADAEKFKLQFAATPWKRSKATDAKLRVRSKTTVHTNLRMLKILWNQQFKALGFVGRVNPWEGIKLPKLPKTAVHIPSEQEVEDFFIWIEKRYPGWELIRLFFEVKALSGCRLMDLCSAKSAKLDVKAKTLTIPPEDDKTDQERVIPLPEDIAATLDRIKGPTFLWEQYVKDARQYRWGTKNRDQFTPQLLSTVVKNISVEYRKQTGNRIRSHDFRRRAITLFAKATGSADAVKQTFNLDAQTARRYYLAAESLDARDMLAKMADVLRPKKG